MIKPAIGKTLKKKNNFDQCIIWNETDKFVLIVVCQVSLVECTRILSHVERYDVMVPQRLHTREKRSLFTDKVG